MALIPSDALVLIADPTPGRMRGLLQKEVDSRMLGEIARTLINAPLEQIEQALRAPL